MRDQFIAAIHTKNKLQLTFFSKEDGRNLVRTCAPMDFGPSTRTTNKDDRFHFWDYDSDKKTHTLSLLPAQVVGIVVLDAVFDPSEFVTWPPRWIVVRDWGVHS